MSKLADILLAPHHREAVIADGVRLLEAHVTAQGAIKRGAIRAALAVARGVRPDILSMAVDRLLPELVSALSPLYERFAEQRGGDFALFLHQHLDEASAAVLGAIDARVARSQYVALKPVYARLRASAAEDMPNLLPRIARLVSAYA